MKISPINPAVTEAGKLKTRKILMRRTCRPSHRKKQMRKKDETKRIVVVPDEPCGGSVLLCSDLILGYVDKIRKVAMK